MCWWVLYQPLTPFLSGFKEGQAQQHDNSTPGMLIGRFDDVDSLVERWIGYGPIEAMPEIAPRTLTAGVMVIIGLLGRVNVVGRYMRAWRTSISQCPDNRSIPGATLKDASSYRHPPDQSPGLP